MISIVRGNDFRLRIPVLLTESGVSAPFDFTGAEVTVNIKSCYRSSAYPHTIEGSEVIVSVDGSKIINGTYAVELIIKKDGNMRSYVAKGFRIVESDAERTPVEVGVETYELDTRVIVGYNGGTVDVSGQIKEHNESKDSHRDIRDAIHDCLVDAQKYTDSAIGDIGAALDVINGEVV